MSNLELHKDSKIDNIIYIFISLKGFCSPLATTNYNINLAKRRVSSVENYFKDYNNGVFVKYINNKNPNEGGI